MKTYSRRERNRHDMLGSEDNSVSKTYWGASIHPVMFVLIFALAGHSWKNYFSITETQIKLANSAENKKVC